VCVGGRQFAEQVGGVTPEEAKRARAEGMRRYFSDPERYNAEARQRRSNSAKSFWETARAKGGGTWTLSDESRANIAAAVRRRYAENKAAWLEANGNLALEGKIKWGRIAWDVVRELRAEGTPIDDLAVFFQTQPYIIRRGLKRGA